MSTISSHNIKFCGEKCSAKDSAFLRQLETAENVLKCDTVGLPCPPTDLDDSWLFVSVLNSEF